MAQSIPEPDPSSLLPPLLSCLPAAFASSRPPPALLPLLSPVLRQRVQLLSCTTIASSRSRGSSWLPLLCWDPTEASKLAAVVEGSLFEPHPVSGEIELGVITPAAYRRLDTETLQSLIGIHDLGLMVIYLWCEGDQEGGGSGWRVSEVRPLGSTSIDQPLAWSATIREANKGPKTPMSPVPPVSIQEDAGDDENDEDGYWAQYDNPPARSPAFERSPAPDVASSVTQRGSTSDDAYYAQYAQVQPAMDNDDPSADRSQVGESSLKGNAFAEFATTGPAPPGSKLKAEAVTDGHSNDQDFEMVHPRPSSASSTSSRVVSHLESSAVSQAHTEFAIQQHISTSIKSLFRLARGAGIHRGEFERMIRTELETLSMLDAEN